MDINSGNTIEKAIALNQKGMALYKSGKWPEAIDFYQAALNLRPDYLDVYYNLGLALSKHKQVNAAICAYEALLELSPNHLPARFQYATLLMYQEKFVKARDQFLIITKMDVNHPETKINLATCYLKLKNLPLARHHYLEALLLLPQETQVLFNLGVIYAALGNIHEAVHYYQRTVEIDADYLAAHQNLGFIYLMLKDQSNALIHFRQVLRLQPENKAVSHTIAILTQENKPAASPPEYVSALFDSYADHYDAHLIKGLSYQVPEIFYKLFLEDLNNKNKKLFNILDLGCGTGLSGELFKPFAKSLIGVDLSENMLALAANKKIYDKLICTDILKFLDENKAQYDLIIAGDVMVYFGELDKLFSKIQETLSPDGIFIFNTEINHEQDYDLLPSGRFSHRKKYLDLLISKNNFMTLYCQEQAIRMQDKEAVPGYVYVVQKSNL